MKMKKSGLAVVLVLLAVGQAEASGLAIGIHGFYFRPTEQAFERIYGSGSGIGAEAVVRLWKNLDFWVGGEKDRVPGQGGLLHQDCQRAIRGWLFPVYALFHPAARHGGGYRRDEPRPGYRVRLRPREERGRMGVGRGPSTRKAVRFKENLTLKITPKDY